MRLSASSSGGLRGNVFADDVVISDGVGLRLVALTNVCDEMVSVLSVNMEGSGGASLSAVRARGVPGGLLGASVVA